VYNIRILLSRGLCGCAIGWSTVLQTGRLRVRFPMGSLT